MAINPVYTPNNSESLGTKYQRIDANFRELEGKNDPLTILSNSSGSITVGSAGTDKAIDFWFYFSRNGQAYTQTLSIVWTGAVLHYNGGTIVPYIEGNVNLGLFLMPLVNGADIDINYNLSEDAGDGILVFKTKKL